MSERKTRQMEGAATKVERLSRKWNSRTLLLRRLLAYVGASLGALVLAGAVVILVFGGAILNHYGKGKAERAFGVLGLVYSEVLQGRSYRARSVHFSRPTFDALLNRDKPPEPFVKSPLMVHEALASIRIPLQVGSLSITNGDVRYCERLAVGAGPAVLTFGAVSLSVEGIANRGEATAAVELRGQGDLMNAGTMKVLMSIPINSPDFSFHYSGSLSAMDLTRLDAFLDIAEHTRIKSGNAQETAFEIDVTDGQARGRVRATYRNLEIALLDKQTANEKGVANRAASFFANVLKIRNANTRGGIRF